MTKHLRSAEKHTAQTRKRIAEFALLTDVGHVRAHNEDTCAADETAGLFVVCDGMGGAAAGEVASGLASRVFLEKARQLALDDHVEHRLGMAVDAANAAVHDKSLREPSLRGMGTTLVALEVSPEADEVWTVNVGDSRCYRLRSGKLERLTWDHSYVEEQVRLGRMTEDEAAASHLRSVITRAVGSHRTVEADVVRHPAMRGDLFLLCSDGLTGEVSPDDIAVALLERGESLQRRARSLVDMANDAGGADNITVVLVRL